MLPEKDINKKIAKGVYLAIWSPNEYCESNTYLPSWWVVKSDFLNQNKNEFQKWINIKDLRLKFEEGKAPVRHFTIKKGKLIYFTKSNPKSAVNVILALLEDQKRVRDNPCCYEISSSMYYNANKFIFRGWIDLEDMAICVKNGNGIKYIRDTKNAL